MCASTWSAEGREHSQSFGLPTWRLNPHNGVVTAKGNYMIGLFGFDHAFYCIRGSGIVNNWIYFTFE